MSWADPIPRHTVSRLRPALPTDPCPHAAPATPAPPLPKTHTAAHAHALRIQSSMLLWTWYLPQTDGPDDVYRYEVELSGCKITLNQGLSL